MKGLAKVACLTMSLLLAACSHPDTEKPAAAAPATAAPTVFESMTGTLIPRSNRIWELAGDLYDDKGNLDPAKLTDAQWLELKDAAVAMGVSAKALAAGTGIKVAAAGVKIQNEGTAGAFGVAEVQKAIDADPKGFSEHAAKLVAMADEIATAATAHDAKKMDDASARLTDVCGACHSRYWYPNQPAQ